MNPIVAICRNSDPYLATRRALKLIDKDFSKISYISKNAVIKPNRP